jgi:hypothetical protein
MRRILKRSGRARPSPALIIALIALFVGLGGIGYAASKIGTKQIKNGAVTTKKLHKQAVKASKLGSNAVKTGKLADGAVSTDKLGNGAVTQDKLESSLEPRWAVVNADGTLARGRNVQSVQLAATNVYDVIFNTDVRDCAYVATVGRADDTVSLGGLPVVNRDPTNPNGVRVFILDQPGIGATFLPRPFHLQVEC